MRFLPLLALAVSALFSSTGCLALGCDAGTSNYDSSPVTLTAPRTSAARLSSCGQGTADRVEGFTFSIDASDGSFVVALTGAADIGRAIPLSVGYAADASTAQVATTDDQMIRLTYNPGQTPADDSGLTSALVTVVSAPTGDSTAPLSLTLDLHFLDGRELSGTFTAPVERASACPVE